MARQRVMFSTLYPQQLAKLREDQNTLDLVREYLHSFTDKYDLEVFSGSAHRDAVKSMQELLACYDVPHEVCLIPYEHKPEYDARRAHEIGFCKQWLASQWRRRAFDYLLFLDADIYVSFADVDKCIQLIDDPMTFVRIPYVLRDSLTFPPEQFGAVVHTKLLLDRIDYVPVVYQTQKQNGRIFRSGAPDCNIQFHLQKNGAKNVRPREIESRHYTQNAGAYRLFRNDRASQHRVMRDLVGFDPEFNGMALDPEGVLALHHFCQQQPIEAALDLGTGTGNSSLALLHAGVQRVWSIDQHEQYTVVAETLIRERFPERELHFLTLPLTAATNVQGRPYDLSCLSGHEFDLVVVDGPQRDAWGAAQSALQAGAKYYFFHDAQRDWEQIRWFMETLARRGERCSKTDIDLGAGVSIVRRDDA